MMMHVMAEYRSVTSTTAAYSRKDGVLYMIPKQRGDGQDGVAESDFDGLSVLK